MRSEWNVENIKQLYKEERTENLFGYYDNKKFWEEFGNSYIYTFADENIETMNKNLLINAGDIISRMNQLAPFDNILEVGCGFGRVLGFVWANRKDIQYKNLKGLEISSTMIDKSKEFFEGSEVVLGAEQSPEIVQGNACDMPFKNQEFDLVYTHVCLTHIPPELVVKAWAEINRVAKKYIILVERYKYRYEHGTPHVWSHEHAEYFSTHGWNIINYMDINEKHGTKVLTLERKT